MASERDRIALLIKQISVQKLFEDCIRGSTDKYYIELTGTAEPIIRKKKDKSKYEVEKTIRGYVNAVPNVLKHCDVSGEGLETIHILEAIGILNPPSAGQLGYTSDDVTVHNQLNQLVDLLIIAHKNVVKGETQPAKITFPQVLPHKLKICVKSSPIKQTDPVSVKVNTSQEGQSNETQTPKLMELSKQGQINFKYLMLESDISKDIKKTLMNLMFAKEWQTLEAMLVDLINESD
jgi:hypothetical protein